MFFKHIQHIATEALKYFFNFDEQSCKHMFATLGFFPFLVQLLFGALIREFHYGLLTVKEDGQGIIAAIKTYKERWENSETWEQFLNYTHNLKELISRH